MPIYEFLCSSCGAVGEHLVLSDSDRITCGQCGGENLKRLLSATSSASGVKNTSAMPGPKDTACCGARPGAQNCVPGSCCGKA